MSPDTHFSGLVQAFFTDRLDGFMQALLGELVNQTALFREYSARD